MAPIATLDMKEPFFESFIVGSKKTEEAPTRRYVKRDPTSLVSAFQFKKRKEKAKGLG